jgi:hypothetical protein
MGFHGPVALFFAAIALGGAVGDADSSDVERELTEGVGGSVNPLGLQNRIDLRWERPLTTSRRQILEAAHLAVGLSHALTPSYTRFGFWAEVAPLSILSVRAGAEPTAYFGTFGSLMSFPHYTDPFDDEAREAQEDEARAGTASRFYVSPRLQMKVGSMVAAGGVDFEWWRSSADGPLFYEPSRDTLLEVRRGRCLTAASAVLRQHDLPRGGRLRYGLVHRLTYVFDAPANRSQRLGVALTYDSSRRILGVDHPRFEAEVLHYLDHPFRQGQWAAGLKLSITLGR